MKVDRIEMSGGCFETTIEPISVRLSTAITLLLTGKLHGKLGQCVLMNVDVKSPAKGEQGK